MQSNWQIPARHYNTYQQLLLISLRLACGGRVVHLPPVEVSQRPEAKFGQYLASRPKPQRCTKQQERMVRFIFSQHNHFDAEKLIGDMKQAGLPVSRATVYRTLTKLVDAGLLRRLELGPS